MYLKVNVLASQLFKNNQYTDLTSKVNKTRETTQFYIQQINAVFINTLY